MFKNIGGKLKILATFVAVFGIFCCCGIGVVYAVAYKKIIAVLLIAGLGSLVCWISSWALYAFGQLVENSDKLVAHFCPEAEKTEFNNDDGDIDEDEEQRIKMLNKWRENGAITEEEYQERLKNP